VSVRDDTFTVRGARFSEGAAAGEVSVANGLAFAPAGTISNEGAGGRMVPTLPSASAAPALAGGGLRELPPSFTSADTPSSFEDSLSSPSAFLVNNREKILILVSHRRR
jgi:hypothetical protein